MLKAHDKPIFNCRLGESLYLSRALHMSELQNDFEEPVLDDLEEVENQDNGSDLAPDSESEHEEQPKVDEEAVKQDAIQKAINKKHFEAKEAERKLSDANKQIAEFQAKERERMAAQVGNIPPMPDPFDDDFDEQVKARDEAIIAQANFNHQNQSYQQQQQFQQQQAHEASQAKIRESMTSYSSKALELGIKQEELQAAGNTVAQYGLSDDLVMHILADSDGPLITKHLAANPQEGFELANMSPYMVGKFLDDIKQKASALKPKTSKAPKPSTNLTGNGTDPELGKYTNLKGAKFE